MKTTLSLCALVILTPALPLAVATGWWIETGLAAALIYPLICALVVGFEKLINTVLDRIPNWNR